MKIALIVIGNELLNGKIQDLNAHWFARFCFERGWELTGVQFVPDDTAAFSRALDTATGQAAIVVTSGGLGPTPDDITKPMMAEYFGRPIEYSDEALRVAQTHYKRRGRTFRTDRIGYQYIPNGFVPLVNPVGFAPGLMYEFAPGRYVCNTPGVPREFRAMVRESLAPRIAPSKRLPKHVIFRTWRLPEARIFADMAPGLWDRLAAFGEVSSLPHVMGVDIGVRIDEPAHEASVIEVMKTSPIAGNIWHIGAESLEEVIVQEASEAGLTFAVAESATGGLSASRITDVSGASTVLRGGVTAYANEAKVGLLGVGTRLVEVHGAVSVEVAREMATGARALFSADIAVSTSGIAGPGGGSGAKPVGTVAVGLATGSDASAEMHRFTGDRAHLKRAFSEMALFTLLIAIRAHRS